MSEKEDKPIAGAIIQVRGTPKDHPPQLFGYSWIDGEELPFNSLEDLEDALNSTLALLAAMDANPRYVTAGFSVAKMSSMRKNLERGVSRMREALPSYSATYNAQADICDLVEDMIDKDLFIPPPYEDDQDEDETDFSLN